MEEYKKITLESYSKNSRVFSEHFNQVFDLEKRKEFVRFIDLLPGKNILDVGCGSGDHALWFRNNGLNVTAIDLSPEMVELTKKKGIDARLMDMENMDFKENSFDGIWAVTSLLHLKKDKIPFVISSFSKILKSKGVLFIVVKEGHGEEFRQDAQNNETKRYFSYWQDKELLSILEKHFDLIEFWREKFRDSTLLHFLLRNKK